MELQILVGAESKEWLRDAEALVNRLEKVLKGLKSAAPLKNAEFEEEDNEDSGKELSDNEDDDFATTKKKPGKKAKAFEEDQGEVETESEEEDESFEKPTKKKAKKLTVDDVNDACKERAADEGGGKAGRSAVLSILKKKFKVQSVTDLEEKQYAAVISAMKS